MTTDAALREALDAEDADPDADLPPSAHLDDACAEGHHVIAEGVCTRCGLGTCTLTDWLGHDLRR